MRFEVLFEPFYGFLFDLHPCGWKVSINQKFAGLTPSKSAGTFCSSSVSPNETDEFHPSGDKDK